MGRFYNIEALGESSGVKVVSNPTLTILEAVLFPRECLSEFSSMPEATRAGVYILFNSADDHEQPHVYIGQSGAGLVSRLRSHDRTKSDWADAIVFCENDDKKLLMGSHAKWIEADLLVRARKCGAVVLGNETGSNKPQLSRHLEGEAKRWAQEIVDITLMLELPVFKNHVTKSIPVNNGETLPAQPPQRMNFHCSNRRGAEAYGYLSDTGFVVLAGSRVSDNIMPSLRPSDKKMRRDLERDGTVLGGIFQHDYTFGASSSAASVIMGVPKNGKTAWRSDTGITLGEYLSTTGKEG